MSVHVRLYLATGSDGNVGFLNNSIPKDLTIGDSIDIPAGVVALGLHETTGTEFRFGIVTADTVDLPGAPDSHRWTTSCGELSFAVTGPSVLKTAVA